MKTIHLQLDEKGTRFFKPGNVLYYAEPVIVELKTADTFSKTSDITLAVYSKEKKLVAAGGEITEDDKTLFIPLDLSTKELKSIFIKEVASFREYFTCIVRENVSKAVIGSCEFVIHNNPLAFCGESKPCQVPPVWMDDINEAIAKHEKDTEAHYGVIHTANAAKRIAIKAYGRIKSLQEAVKALAFNPDLMRTVDDIINFLGKLVVALKGKVK